MARKKSIDRDCILDAAESVLLASGALHLTLDAVADEAGISKGGLTYTFGTKEELLSALLERQTDRVMAGIEKFRESYSDKPCPELFGLFEVIKHGREPERGIVAKILAALMYSQASLESSRTFLKWISRKFSSDSVEDRRARLAFMAIQGAFLLNGLGLMDISLKSRNALLEDAIALASNGHL